MNWQVIWARIDKTRRRELALLFIVFLFTGALAWSSWLYSRPTQSPLVLEPGRLPGVDTFIPNGMVLVPIEIQNVDAIDAIVQENAIIDLYVSNPNHGGSRRLAQNIGLYRAPLNPRQFAVLVPDASAPKIVTHNGPFFAVVLNPNSVGKRRPKEGKTSKKPADNKISILDSSPIEIDTDRTGG